MKSENKSYRHLTQRLKLQRPQETQALLKGFLMGCLLCLALNQVGCQSNPPIPKWDAAEHGGIWVGSQKDAGLVRKQVGAVCRGDAVCINDMIAFTQEGFESFFMTFVLGCEKWKGNIKMIPLRDVLRDLSVETSRVQ